MCVIWGSTWLVIKVGVAEMPVFLFAGFRLVAAALALLVMFLLLKLRWTIDKSFFKYNAVAAASGYFVSYSLIFGGEQYIGSGLAAILFATFPLHTVLLAHWMLDHERISWQKSTGIVTGFFGVVVIFHNEVALWRWSNETLIGMLFLLGSALSSAFSSVLVKKHLTQYHPIEVTLVQSVIGALMFLAAGFSFENVSAFPVNETTLFCILYLGVLGTAVAIAMYFWLLKRTEAVKLSLIAYLTPVTAVILGWLVLDEQLSTALALGSVLVFVGIGMVTRRRPAGVLLDQKRKQEVTG